MGFILLGLSCLSPIALSGTVLFMFAHGVMAALGFALVGWFYEQTHTRMLADWGGFGKKAPFISVLFVMTALASAGVPGFANFIGEMIILVGAWDRYRIPTIAAVGGLVITAGYMLMTVRGSIQGPVSPRGEHLVDAKGWQRAPYLLLMSALVLVGFLPVVLLGTITPSVDAVIKKVYAFPKIIIKQEVYPNEP
jgi:NADH-quinone oxidoreductase subunit M